jgi:hypothetical protein
MSQLDEFSMELGYQITAYFEQIFKKWLNFKNFILTDDSCFTNSLHKCSNM